MKSYIGQLAYDYLMKTSGEIIKISESLLSKHKSHELNLIGSEMAQFANEFLEESKKYCEKIGTTCTEIKESANKLCGIADNLDLTYGDSETAESLDRIESSILSSIEKLDE